MEQRTPVYLEVGTKRVFAGAIDWPGWSRAARTETAALEALLRHGSRYAAAITSAAPVFAPPATIDAFDVVERLSGGGATDFGVPSVPPAADERSVDPKQVAALVSVLQACWRTFDVTAASASGSPLRRGPRGGGRELAAIVDHVVEAEAAYLLQLGARPPSAADVGAGERSGPIRAAIVAALAARAAGQTPLQPSRVKRPWSPRYFVRRAAWHVLDHAWEIEDRVIPADD